MCKPRIRKSTVFRNLESSRTIALAESWILEVCSVTCWWCAWLWLDPQHSDNPLLDCLVHSLCNSILLQIVWGHKFPPNASLSSEDDEFVQLIFSPLSNRGHFNFRSVWFSTIASQSLKIVKTLSLVLVGYIWPSKLRRWWISQNTMQSQETDAAWDRCHKKRWGYVKLRQDPGVSDRRIPHNCRHWSRKD